MAESEKNFSSLEQKISQVAFKLDQKIDSSLLALELKLSTLMIKVAIGTVGILGTLQTIFHFIK